MFIDDQERTSLTEALKLVESVYKKVDYQFKEYACLVAAMDSLESAIYKSSRK